MGHVVNAPQGPGSQAGSPLHLTGLHVTYGKIQALDSLDLTMPPGPVGLLGPNGAGKSTTLKAVLGFVRPRRGEVHVYGLDARQHGRTIRRRVGYMPERDTSLAGLTGYQAVALAGELSGLPRREARSRAHEVLHYTGLGEARYRKAEEYSTGMRQRVKLAQALIHDPPLLFLDEPTNGLDPAGRDEMLALIQDLTHHHRKDVILSTHILPDAEALVEWVAILQNGRLVGAGPIREIIPASRPAFRVRATGNLDALRRCLRERAIEGELDHRGAGLLYLPDGATPPSLFEAVHASGSVLRSIAPHRPNLEEAFFHALDPAS